MSKKSTVKSTGLTQNQWLVTHLRGTGKQITVSEAKNKYNIGNLRARVSELRAAGLTVATKKLENGAASYSISVRNQDGSRKKLAV
jgi:hypothetical protein